MVFLRCPSYLPQQVIYMLANGDPHQNSCVLQFPSGGARFDNLNSLPYPAIWYGPFKFLVDFSLALLVLVLSAPALLLACLAVKLTSRGPMLYRQTRLGRGGKPFTIFKIRTMTHDCEKHSGICWAKPNDPRVTAVGRLLRRTHLDELPQLWNVMRGDMSLVGPRPERPEFFPALMRAIPRYRERLFVRPGVTGLAQIQLPADSDLESVRRKLAYDLYYVARMSPGLDLRILLGTILYMLRLPVSLPRLLFGIPHGDPVERTLDDLKPDVVALPELNAV
jgi:lipopolysaccharide/colanic/teichoic acid biosynthesis glycosyltransferase